MDEEWGARGHASGREGTALVVGGRAGGMLCSCEGGVAGSAPVDNPLWSGCDQAGRARPEAVALSGGASV